MIRRIKSTWARAPWLLSAFVLALALTSFFAVRLVISAIYWADPRHVDQDIASWMTPGYVALSWDVPREVVADALDLTPQTGRPPRLDDLAAARGVPFDTLAAELEAAIARFRATAP